MNRLSVAFQALLHPAVEPGTTPIPMILFCPNCGTQHVDTATPATGWTNPPHRSHLCEACDHVWRPADVCTVGVAEITTRGMIDDEPPIRGDVNRRASEGG